MQIKPKALAPKPQGCTSFKLRKLMRVVSQHYDTELAQVGLRNTQYSLLSQVLALGPVRPSELATAMMVDASTLTRNLRPLINAGWVELQTGADERSRCVVITPAGRDKWLKAQRIWRNAQERLNVLLGSERVAALHELIDDSLDLLVAVSSGDEDHD